MTTDTIDEALEFLQDRGPIFGGFLANHGPMAAEALVQLGRDDAVLPYLEWYSERLEDSPWPGGRVTESSWREMLGRHEKFAAWKRFFEAEVAARPWRDVLATWVDRLAPGLWAALMHGLIRTGHASRSLADKETPLRLGELAQGLALWASWYQELPDVSEDGGSLSARQAFYRLPLRSPQERGRREPMDSGDSIPGLAEAGSLVDASSPLPALSGMTETYAGLDAANAGLPGNSPILLIHAVTGPSAVRLIAPHVPVESQRNLLRYAWQAAARINASWNFAGLPSGEMGIELDREDVIDRAVATRDEHAMKLVEACLREHALNPQHVYLAAARDVVERLRN